MILQKKGEQTQSIKPQPFLATLELIPNSARLIEIFYTGLTLINDENPKKFAPFQLL